MTARLDHLVDCLDVIFKDEAGGVSLHYAIAVFTGPWLAGEPRAGGDARAVRWAALDELGRLPLTPNAETIIAAAARLIGI